MAEGIMQLSLQIFSKNSVEESFPVFLIQFIAMQNILLKNMKTNSSGIVFIFLMAKLYLRRRNLNYKRECELWHYEDWKTSRYRKWERNV